MNIKRLHIFILFSLIACITTPSAATEPDLKELYAQPENAATSPSSAVSPLYAAFNEFNSRIRDSRIGKEAARRELPRRLAAIAAEYYGRRGRDYSPAQWVFPVAGYTAGAIEKRGNHGFVARGYDFFSGNRHGGHPAYDIFIRDRNQDSRDDRSGKAARVISMTGGVVVALEKGWVTGSGLRGGNYIWVYDPTNSLLVYYAHNTELFVEVGTLVRPGDLLATLGRTGRNADKQRSPTHLHFSVLKLRDGQPTAVPFYRALQTSRSVPADFAINPPTPSSPE